jgi:hypothetical protein
MKRRFQFSLRTLFVVVTAWAVLLAQWPLVDWEPPAYWRIRLIERVVSKQHGDYQIPHRVIVVVSVEAAALIGWIGWRRLRRAATKS